MKTQLCAVALLATTALSANVQADDFTYLSGGLLFNQQGFLTQYNKANQKYDGKSQNIPASYLDLFKESEKQKTKGFGYYLNGSVGFDNQVFVEGRVSQSRLITQNLLGVGYHYPVTQQLDLYGLAGMSQRTIALSENFNEEIKNSAGKITGYKHHQQFSTHYADGLKPTIELGLKAHFNEVAGVRVAYRFAQFGNQDKLKFDLKNAPALQSYVGSNDYKVSKNLHEGHIGGYYKISDNLAAEAGYTYTSSLKGAVLKDKSAKDHAFTAGLRYNFS